MSKDDDESPFDPECVVREGGPRKYKKGSSSVGGAVGGFFDWTHKIRELQ